MNEWPRVVGFAGKMRAGKDTAASHLVEHHGYQRVAFGDAIKRIALDIDPTVASGMPRLSHLVSERGWDGAKAIPEVRRVLQDVGRAVRNQWPSFWVDVLERQIADGGRHVIPDVRFPGEVAMILAAGGTVLRIDRPTRDAVTNGDDISETALDSMDLPTIVNDRGCFELGVRVEQTLAALHGRD